MDAGNSTKAAPFDLSRAYDVPLEELIRVRDAARLAGEDLIARLLTQVVTARTERGHTMDAGDLPMAVAGELMPPVYEYRCEIIPLIPGEGGRTSVILSGYGEDGWRVASANVVVVGQRVATDLGAPASQMGLAVILERAKRDE